MPEPPALVLSGIVANAGVPLPGVVLAGAAYSSQGNVPLAQDTALSDANGAFRIRLELDTPLAKGFYDLSIRPPFRSGLTTLVVQQPIAFDGDGRADTTLAIEVPRAEPAVPDGPRLAVDPRRLVGHYDGRQRVLLGQARAAPPGAGVSPRRSTHTTPGGRPA